MHVVLGYSVRSHSPSSMLRDKFRIGLPAFHLCYLLEVALNRLAIGGIGSEKKIRHVLVGGMHPLIPPSGSAPAEVSL